MARRVNAGLAVLAAGGSIAVLALGAWWTSGGTLDSLTLSLDPTRANLDSADGGGGYRIDLETLAAGDRVLVRFELRENATATVSVRDRAAFDGAVAPAPASALATRTGNAGDLNFTAPVDGEFALAIESAAGPPKGKVRVTWDPPVDTPRNVVYLGVVRTALVFTAPVGLVIAIAGWWRRRASA